MFTIRTWLAAGAASVALAGVTTDEWDHAGAAFFDALANGWNASITGPGRHRLTITQDEYLRMGDDRLHEQFGDWVDLCHASTMTKPAGAVVALA